VEIEHYKLKFHEKIRQSRRNPNYTKKLHEEGKTKEETQKPKLNKEETQTRRNPNKKQET